MAKLDSLIVDLQANTAALRKGLDDAAGMLASFGKKVQGVAKDLHELTELKSVEFGKEIIKGLAELFEKGVSAAEQMNKLSQAVGVPVEQFSRMNFAAQAVGMTTEDFAKSLEKLDKSLGLAAGGAQQQKAIFQALGISVTDAGGKVRGTDAVLGDLAERFSSMQDGAAKTTLAIEVFGKAGADMIPFLNEGRDGIDELEKQADALGITLSTKSAQSAKELGDTLNKLKSAGLAVVTQAAVQLAPILVKMADQFLNSKDAVSSLKEAATVLATAFKILVSAGVIVSGVFEAIGVTLARVASAIANFVQGNFKEAMNDAIAVVTNKDSGEAVEKIWTQLKAVWSDGATAAEDAGRRVSDSSKKSSEQVLKDFERLKALPSSVDAMKELTKILEEYGKKAADIAGGGKDPLAEIQYRLSQGDLAKFLAAIGNQADVMKKKILDAAAALQKLEVGNLKVQIGFDNKLASNKLDFDVAQRTQNFNNIGGGQTNALASQTQGFSDFNDAITKYAAAVREKAQWEEQAKVAGLKGDIDAQQGALLFAQSAEFAAEKANLAASAFEQLKSEGSNFIEGLKVLGTQFTKNLGALGSTIDDAIKGFQQGGIWGALAALIMDLLSMMDGWKDIQAIAQGALKKALTEMSKGLNSVIQGLQPLFGAIDSIAGAVHSVLGPILQLIGTILKGIAPLLEVLGVSLKVVGGTLGPLIQIIGGILDPIFKLMALTLSPLVILFLYLKVAVDGVALGFNKFIEWADEIVGKHDNQGNVDAAQAQFDSDKATADQFVSDFMKNPFDALGNFIQDDANSLKDLGDQTNKTTTAMQKMTQQLTNVPAGIKVALNRFNASSTTGGGSTGIGGSVSGSGVTIHNLNVQTSSYDDLLKKLLAIHERNTAQSGGPPPH